MTRRRPIAALAVALGCGVAVEALAHLADIPDPTAATSTRQGEVMLDGNPWLLWELVPGTHAEQGVTVSVNDHGFRGPPRGPRRGPRALALGDSSVYGFGVEDAEVFTSVLEARGGAEYVNAAVPGYSSYQALNLLQMRGLALEPDLLLVGTIWSDNNFDSFTDRELLASYAGWEASWRRDARVLLERSALFRWLDWTLRVGPQGERARKVGWQLGGDDPRTGRRRVAIADYAANLDALCRVMHARGGGVAFLMLANREDIDAAAPAPAWEVYRRAMWDTAERWGAPIVDLPAAFRATGRSADALFLDQMHPTALGHRVMAEAVAAALPTWPTTPIVLDGPAEPVPAWIDPFEGKGVERGPMRSPHAVLSGTLRIPQYERGVIVFDVATPDEPRALASTSMAGPGRVSLKLPALPPRIIVRVTLDADENGPTQGDRVGEIGPLEVPMDGRLDFDFGRAAFSSPGRP